MNNLPAVAVVRAWRSIASFWRNYWLLASLAAPRKGLSIPAAWSAISKSVTLEPKDKGDIGRIVTLLSRLCHREKSEVKVISQRQNQRKSNSLTP